MKATDVPIGAMFTYNGGLYWRIEATNTSYEKHTNCIVALVITPHKHSLATPTMNITIFTGFDDIELYEGDGDASH